MKGSKQLRTGGPTPQEVLGHVSEDWMEKRIFQSYRLPGPPLTGGLPHPASLRKGERPFIGCES